MRTVFAGLRRSRLALNQRATSVTQWDNLAVVVNALSTGALMYTVVSVLVQLKTMMSSDEGDVRCIQGEQ